MSTLQIEKSFRFYDYLEEESFLNEQIKDSYVLVFVEKNTYHFSKQAVSEDAFYQIAYYSQKQDIDTLKRAFRAKDVLEAELENMGGYYYYLLLEEEIVLKDDRNAVLSSMKQRLESFNLAILILLAIYFIYKYFETRHIAYAFFVILNVLMLLLLKIQIKKIEQGMMRDD